MGHTVDVERRVLRSSQFFDVACLATMIARARARAAPTPLDVRIARDRLAVTS